MTDFIEFLRERQQHEEQGKEKWERLKREWLTGLEELHHEVKGWLEEAVAQGLVELSQDEVKISEAHLGTYPAPRLVLHIGQDTILLEPVGALILGAKGRVDMYGEATRIMLFLKQGTWRYRDELGNYPMLTKEVFLGFVKRLLS